MPGSWRSCSNSDCWHTMSTGSRRRRRSSSDN
jgi:hypothetical protein